MPHAMLPFKRPQVEAAFDAFPEAVRPTLLALRRLIFDTAARMPEIGCIEETLKWGQPAYLTPETRAGSTLRLGVATSGRPALYAHCRTSLISDFQALFPDDFVYEGTRGVHLDPDAGPPGDRLRLLIAAALAYRLKSAALRA